ncbi:MAG: helicase, partial [Planctomycetota bacterium]
RAYRMGQKNPVHVYKFVTTCDPMSPTIEEGLLTTLASKQDLADASLNFESDVNEVAMQSGMEDLKRRLEVILPPKPAAPVDESQQRSVVAEAELLQAERKQKVSQASGKLLTAALSLAGELAGQDGEEPDAKQVDTLTQKLAETVERDDQGRPQIRISLEDDASLRSLASTLAKLLG